MLCWFKIKRNFSYNTIFFISRKKSSNITFIIKVRDKNYCTNLIKKNRDFYKLLTTPLIYEHKKKQYEVFYNKKIHQRYCNNIRVIGAQPTNHNIANINYLLFILSPGSGDPEL